MFFSVVSLFDPNIMQGRYKIESGLNQDFGFELNKSDTKNLFAVIGSLKLDRKDTIAQGKIISDLRSVIEELDPYMQGKYI